ncbi:hypothetical protein PRIPAC_93395 [Pristionchus pacificus]|uniref:Uncharacterized protein n=1 Tax=Pristionchus pacificus TaxID=54126 RepID=A0A2A6BAL9_PRIPA|nr:hypothetical protein PRIPAC_93395 [Pristionchus pacificus]|eukprot:PDM62918.1 hypothetical protein PRIPAC_50133 [Pristionchus pacificus]
MRLTTSVLGNLNKRHWNRRVWEVGYKGPLMPQQKATGRPDYAISGNMVALTRERFAREFGVMKMLAHPYVDESAERHYLESKGVQSLKELREMEEQKIKDQTMPSKPKATSPTGLKRKGNVGTLLHKHTTIEDSLGYLANRNRWD